MNQPSLYDNFYSFSSANPELDCVQKSFEWMKVVFSKMASKRANKMREATLERARAKNPV